MLRIMAINASVLLLTALLEAGLAFRANTIGASSITNGTTPMSTRSDSLTINSEQDTPVLSFPPDGLTLSSMEVELQWVLPERATQIHLQVVPANNAGPGIDIIRNATTSFYINPPPIWYTLLPGMSYIWKVRATNKQTFTQAEDPDWGSWSETRIFRTPIRHSKGITLASPSQASTMANEAVTLRWENRDEDVFYYEVQVIQDPVFETDPSKSTKPVWWNLIHGGVSNPKNSWITPRLVPGQTYYWRVRPRVQGDGTPVEWSLLSSLHVIAVETVASNLAVPWALAFAPDGRLFLTQRPCEVRVLVNDGGQFRLQSEPVARLACENEVVGDGLRGLALDPGFSQNGHLYVVYIYKDQDGARNTRLSRLTESKGRAGEERILLESIADTGVHTAGRLKFGPDGKLYLASGDTGVLALPQNPTSLAGKILRLNSDGSVPTDNPGSGSLVYSLGHRNPQGLAWQPITKQLFSTEHGPSGELGGACCHDELNLITPGSNYGWPTVFGAANDSRFIGPVLTSTEDTWAPAGASFYRGQIFPEWDGNLFFATLRGAHLHRVVLQAPGFKQVASHERFFEGQFGRLRDVIQSPDGFIYFSTSNRDGRSWQEPVPGDDRIMRVLPGEYASPVEAPR